MKKWFCILMISGMGIPPVMASGLGLFGSYWDSKDADDTFGGGAVLRLDLNPNLQLDIRGSYYKFDDREMGVKAELEIIPVEVALMVKFDVNPTITPYIGGGAGYYFAEAELKAEGEKLKIDIDDEIGFFALGGIEIKLAAAFSLFAEVKYTWLEFDKAKAKDSGFPELDESFDIDLKMDGIGANVGALFTF